MDSSCLVLAGMLLATKFLFDSVLVGAQNTNFSFPYFNTIDSFLMIDDIEHDVQTSSFTMTPKGAALFSESCGKLFYKDQVRMKDAYGVVATFHTAFTFQMYGPNIYGDADGWFHADGMTFTFGRNSTLNQFLNNAGMGDMFCLMRQESNGVASNRVFAVEFDTHLNPEVNDSSNNHVGVNINSMNSTWSHNLCEGSVWKTNCTYLCNGGYFTAWIDYDSPSQMLEVFLANGSLTNGIPKPSYPLINTSLASAFSLSYLLDDYMYVGFTASTGRWGVQLYQIQSWTFTSSGMPELDNFTVPHQRIMRPIIPGVSAGAVAAFLLLLGSCFIIGRFQRRTITPDPVPDIETDNSSSRMDLSPELRTFTYKELRKATKNFSRSRFLGSGGSGKVYKGTLPSGDLVAVKRMKHGSEHEKHTFQAEIDSLSKIDGHPNLVQLKGWCEARDQSFLVYQYMCHGSLDQWLFGCSKRWGNRPKRSPIMNKLPLHWRYSILRGVAAALLYLHEECAHCVLHRDIKSSNVLLDDLWTAHLGDFGLARLVSHWKMGEMSTPGAGTLGYMAPELPHTGRATKQTDVYSFGVLVLEVMCGTRPLDTSAASLVDRVWLAHGAGNILQVADSKLGTFPLGDSDPARCDDMDPPEVSRISIRHAQDAAMKDKKLITNLLQLALRCCDPNPEDRPPMSEVSQWLWSSEDMEMARAALPSHRPRAPYGEGPRGGLSEAPMPSSSRSPSSGPNAQHTAQGSFQPAVQDAVQPAVQDAVQPAATDMLKSFASPDSSVLSGR